MVVDVVLLHPLSNRPHVGFERPKVSVRPHRRLGSGTAGNSDGSHRCGRSSRHSCRITGKRGHRLISIAVDGRAT